MADMLALQRLSIDARRSERELRQELAVMSRREGLTRCADVIARPAPEVGRVPVARLLKACRRVGVSRTRSMLASVNIMESTPLEEINDFDRGRLVARLRYERRVYRPQTRVQPITAWCEKCGDESVPMPNGRCGWCDTVIAVAEVA